MTARAKSSSAEEMLFMPLIYQTSGDDLAKINPNEGNSSVIDLNLELHEVPNISQLCKFLSLCSDCS